MYFLLLVIIILLVYIAFFTPEKRRKREIRRVQNIFNTPISHELFDIDDPKNKTNPDDFVSYEGNVVSRNFALISYELKKNDLEAKIKTEKSSNTDPEENEYIIMDGSPEHGRRYVFRAIRCYRYLGLNNLVSKNQIDDAYEAKLKDVSQTDIEKVKYAHEFLLDSLNIFSTLSKDAKNDFYNFLKSYDIFLKSKTEQERKNFEEVDEELQLELLDFDVNSHPTKYKH